MSPGPAVDAGRAVGAARIAIIGYSTHAVVRRLSADLVRRGHRVDISDPALLGTQLRGGTETVTGMPSPEPPDVVVLTVSTDQVAATRAVRVLIRAGVPVVNAPDAVLTAADKFATASALTAAGLPVPATVNVCTLEAVVQEGRRMGYPVVLKAADGSEGTQVVMLEDEADAAGGVAAIRRSLGLDPGVRSSLVVQEVVGASLGRDRRLVVMGGAVRAAMDREARPGEWRSNMSQGARPVAARASEQETRIATAAIDAIGLDFGTVDIMTGDDGPVVIEVNAFGDMLDVAMINEVDLVGCLADLAESRAGLRAGDDVRARPLFGAALEELTTFCWDRWHTKLDELSAAELVP